jgi:CBS domain-containing protein
MITVRRLLESKKKGFRSVTADTTAYEALQIMALADVGALLVVNGNKLQGIFTERDYSRKVILKGKSSKETPVGELMTAKVYCVGPDDSLEQCMAIMNEKKIRHLPVVDGGNLIGIVSIRNVVNMILDERETTIKNLEQYIYGSV